MGIVKTKKVTSCTLNSNYVLVTQNKMQTNSGIIDLDKPDVYQTVAAKGVHCNLVNQGDEVIINWGNYVKVLNANGDSLKAQIEAGDAGVQSVKKQYVLDIPELTVNDVDYYMIKETDIIAVVKTEESEVVKVDKPKIVVPKGNVSVK